MGSHPHPTTPIISSGGLFRRRRVLPVLVLLLCVSVQESGSQSLLSFLFSGNSPYLNTGRSGSTFRQAPTTTTKAPYQFNSFKLHGTPITLNEVRRSNNFRRQETPRENIQQQEQPSQIQLQPRSLGPLFRHANDNAMHTAVRNRAANFDLNEELPIVFQDVPPSSTSSRPTYAIPKAIITNGGSQGPTMIIQPILSSKGSSSSDNDVISKSTVESLANKGTNGDNKSDDVQLIKDGDNDEEAEETNQNAISERFQVELRSPLNVPIVDDALSDIPPLPQVDYDDQNDNEFNTVDDLIRGTGNVGPMVARTTSTERAPTTTATLAPRPTTTTTQRATTRTTTTTTTTTPRTTTTTTSTTTTAAPRTTTSTTPTPIRTTSKSTNAFPAPGGNIPISDSVINDELRDLPPLADFGEDDYDELLDGAVNSAPGVTSQGAQAPAQSKPAVVGVNPKPIGDFQDIPPVIIDDDDSEGPVGGNVPSATVSTTTTTTRRPSTTTTRPFIPSAEPPRTVQGDEGFGDLPPVPVEDEDEMFIEIPNLPKVSSIITTARTTTTTTTTTTRPTTTTTARPIPIPPRQAPAAPESNKGDNYDDLAPIPTSEEDYDQAGGPPIPLPPEEDLVTAAPKRTFNPTTTTRPPPPTQRPRTPSLVIDPSAFFPRVPSINSNSRPSPAIPPQQQQQQQRPKAIQPPAPTQRFPPSRPVQPAPESRPVRPITPQEMIVNIKSEVPGAIPDLQGLRGLLENILSTFIRTNSGTGGSALPQVLNVNIGTINVNSGQNSQVTYNGWTDSNTASSGQQPAVVPGVAPTDPFNQLKSSSQQQDFLRPVSSSGDSEDFRPQSSRPPSSDEGNNSESALRPSFDQPSSSGSGGGGGGSFGPPLPVPPIEQYDDGADFPPSPALTGSRSFRVPLPEDDSSRGRANNGEAPLEVRGPPLPISPAEEDLELIINVRTNMGKEESQPNSRES